MFSYIYHLNIVMVHIINNLNYLYINIYYFVCCETEYYKNIYRTLIGMLTTHICYAKLSWLMSYNCHNLVVSTNTNNGVNYEHNKKI